MDNLPPIISPPVAPPPLPANARGESLEVYVDRCKIICIVAASLFLVGICGFVVQYLEQGSANFGALGFAVWFVIEGYGAAWLLHKRNAAGYLAALPCLAIILLLIPVGTIFGVLGLKWLNKAEPLLRRSRGGRPGMGRG